MESRNRIDLIEIFILFCISLVKTMILHVYLESQHYFEIIIAVIPPLLIVYGLLNLIKGKKRNLYIIIGHTIISFILFADLMYYQHFGFLPSARLIPLLKLVPSVANSVAFMIHPMYLIMLIDIIPLIIYFKSKKKRNITYSRRSKRINRYVVIIMLIAFIVNITFINGESMYAYSDHGVYSYHVYDIVNIISDSTEETSTNIYDLDTIIEEVNNKEYLSDKRRYHGIAKNRNVIIIQFESLQDFVINRKYRGQELTPNLNKLLNNDSIYFNNYYQQVGPGNTSDAEFTVNNSMYPIYKYSVYKKYTENNFYTLPHLLKENGYSTIALHGYKEEFWNRNIMYPNQGIDDFISIEDLNDDNTIGLGIGDKSFYNQSIKKLSEINKPFYSLMITLSSHNPYEIPEEKQKIKLSEEHEDTLFGNYIQSVNYADEALGEFIVELKENGLYDNSLIMIYGDHSGLFPNREDNKEIMTEFLGVNYDFDESMNVPLIIHVPGTGINENKSIVGSHVDLFPTIINLLGLKNNKGIMFGQDLNNAKEGFVALQYFVPKGSFIDDKKIFIMSKDGIFKNSRAWNLITKEPIDIENCREGYEKAIKKTDYSNYILENNLIREIINKNK
ncbi:MAG: LTA synthase family protein [Firmicutes bacterium]|nr:LTA synthase family protein [Bacillota bacterium]